MLLKQVYTNDALLVNANFLSNVHYYRDGDDLIFTYKDSSKRPKMHFRYPGGFLRAQPVRDKEVELCNPLMGLDIPSITNRIVNLKDYDMRILFGSEIDLNPKRKDIGMEFTVNFDVSAWTMKYMALSIMKSRNTLAHEDGLEQLRQLKSEAIYIDELKPSGEAQSITRFILPFGYTTDKTVDQKLVAGMYLFEASMAIDPLKREVR